MHGNEESGDDMMQWFRFYHDALDERKVQSLPAELFKTWVNLLCLANKGNPRGLIESAEDVAFALRITTEQAGGALAELVERGLLEVVEDGGYRPHNWDARQHKSDDVNARVDKSRKKNVTLHDTLHSGDVCNVADALLCSVSESVSESVFKEPRYIASQEEREILAVLQSVESYPYNADKDIPHLRALINDFPSVNVLQETKKWAAYKLDNPLKKNQSPRAQLRTWMGNAKTYQERNGNGRKQGTPVPTAVPRSKYQSY